MVIDQQQDPEQFWRELTQQMDYPPPVPCCRGQTGDAHVSSVTLMAWRTLDGKREFQVKPCEYCGLIYWEVVG